MTVKEVLVAARELIADPEHWFQGDLARDEDGQYCEPNSPRASKRCALGAISAAVNFPNYPIADGPEAQEAVRLLGRLVYDRYRLNLLGGADTDDDLQAAVFSLNDRVWGGHAKVLEAFDEAIASCDA